LLSYKKRLMSLTIGLVFSLSAGIALSQSGSSILANDYPERYVVVKGDTLWGISQRFLRDPWRWPEVWQGNPQVENPDLIFPGDVLVLTFVNGRPVLRKLRKESRQERLSPKVRSSAILNAIPVIDPAAIQAYIRAPLVTDLNELATAPYIVDGFDNRLLLGRYSQFYARGFDNVPKINIESEQSSETQAVDDAEVLNESEESEIVYADEYNVFRPGRRFIDPVTKEPLGWEAVDLGLASFLKAGDPARLILTETHEDVTIKDRLRPVFKKEALPFFYPHPPSDEEVRGVIFAY